MKYGVLTLGVLLGSISGVSSALAQSAASGGVTAGGMAQARPSRVMSLDAVAQVEHDTNIAHASAVAAAARGIMLQDTIASPSIAVNLLQPIGRQAVFLNGTVSYKFHKNNKQLDRGRADLTGGLGGKLGPCGSVVRGGYSRGNSEVIDDVLDTSVTNVHEIAQYGLDLACTRSTGLGVILTGSREEASSTASQSRLSNHQTMALLGGFTYQRPAFGSVSVFGNVTRTEFPERPTSLGDTSGYETRAGGVRFTRQLGGRIQTTATAGYTQVERFGSPPVGAPPVTTPAKDFKGATYAGNVSFRASSRLTAEVDAERAVTPSFVSSGSYQIRTKYSVSASYRIGSRIRAELGDSVKNIAVDGAALFSAAPTLTSSRTNVVFGSLRYQQSKRLTVVLTGENEQRKSDNSLYDYTNNRVVLSLDVAL
jgi:hypothetical protein